MNQWLILTAVYLFPLGIVILLYVVRQYRRGRRAETVLAESLAAGLSEPASLHPVVDYSLCLGCATCIGACPEKEVLGLAENRARLITPASCIGHGACHAACPSNAIQLVFGTETRGVDIPLVGADFQSNIPGIYIAGELGGMGLIRNAIEQGRQAVESITSSGRKGRPGQVDIAIVGAGPAGISAALAAKELGLSYQVLEQDTIGGTIAHYPRGKVVMTAPARLPIVGEFRFGETSKENLMQFWEDIVSQAGIEVVTGTRVDSVTSTDTGFELNQGEACRASNVLLTIGRRGTPRRLNVPGEELSKVVYRLVDPGQYQGMNVLVVGGGDSALEAALSLAEEDSTCVTLSYRGEAFNRVKKKNRERLINAEASGHLAVELQSQVQQITSSHIQLKTTVGDRELENDVVVICAGGILPTAFLDSMGVHVQTHFGATQ